MSSQQRKLNGYQNRTTRGAGKALDAGSDVLIQAPTGAGKTGILSQIALETSQKSGKVLILTHRQKLFDQIGDEVHSWTGVKPGSISSDAMSGIDQSPPIVIGMVETVAGRLEDLDSYAAILIDETHHVSQQSAERTEAGSYARIIDACPNAGLVGLTATIFRGDGDELHPRLANAHREVVSVEEARREGRIVPAKTVEGRAPLMNGRTPADLARRELEGKLDASEGSSASAITSKQRGDAYYDTIVADWSDRFGSKQTILFVDSIDEVEDMKGRFSKRYGEGVAVAVHGRSLATDKDAGGRKRVNDDAIDAYAEGRANVLIACQMIGEGFDVPETDVVMSANASLSRLEMNQFCGRGIRSSDGKKFGTFADYGTASVLHGKVEAQHELMDVDAWSAAGSVTSAARAIGRCATAKEGDWSCMAGESASLLMRRDGASFQIFRIDEKATRGSKSASHGKTWDVMKTDEGKQRFTLQQAARIVSDQARADAGYYARQGGFESTEHVNACRQRLDDSKGMFKYYEGSPRDAQVADTAGQRRTQIISDALDGKSKGGINSGLVAKALCKSNSGAEMLRETIGLCQIALSRASEEEGLPMGRRSEAAFISKELSERPAGKMTGGQLQKEAKALSQALPNIATECDNKNVRRVLDDLSEPLLKGQKMLIRDARAALS